MKTLPLLALIEEAHQERMTSIADRKHYDLQYNVLGRVLMDAGWVLDADPWTVPGAITYSAYHRRLQLRTTEHRNRQEAVREAYLESVLEEILPLQYLEAYYREHHFAPVTPRIRQDQLVWALKGRQE